MEERTGTVRPDIGAIAQQIEGSAAQMEKRAEQAEIQWKEAQNRITLAFRTVNQKILQSEVHLDNSGVDELRRPELIYQNLIAELMGVVHSWRLASVQKGDVNDKMAKSLLNCLMKCFKSTGTPAEKQESVGAAFDEKCMISGGTVRVDDPAQDGRVYASLVPGIKLRDLLLCRELVLCGVYEKPLEKTEKPADEAGCQPHSEPREENDGKEADDA